MTDEQKKAYEWALNQQYQSVAAGYARTLAEYIRQDRIACQNTQLLTLDELRNHYITCHDCDDAEYSTTVTCGYVCRSKSSPCRGRVTVGYDFCSYGRRKPELPERAEK